MDALFREHRLRYLERLEAAGAAALIPSAPPRVRNHDSEHRYRPDSDLWYLTGFAEPEAALVLLPRRPGRERAESVLFLRERKPDEEVWTGRRLGVEAAPEALGVERAFPIGELWTRLPELLSGDRRVVYRTGLDEERDRALLAVTAKLRAKVRSGEPLFEELLDTAPILHELRLFKGPAELERMRRAAAITTEAHRLAMAAARPGGHEHEVQAILQHTFLRHGSTGSAYSDIVAAGANACVLHYNDNRAPLRAGELLLVDAGCEWDYYASDVTRTFPIDGRFTPQQRALYQVVLAAQEDAIAAVRPGAPFQAPHDAAVARLARGLVELGLLEGPPERALEEETYKPFYMHRTSHWLGLDVHDCGRYVEDGRPRDLAPGMVLTVEPGLYVAPDEARVEPQWRGIGIRIEDDVLVSAEGCEVLTADAPKGVEEVEAACGRRAPEPQAALGAGRR